MEEDKAGKAERIRADRQRILAAVRNYMEKDAQALLDLFPEGGETEDLLVTLDRLFHYMETLDALPRFRLLDELARKANVPVSLLQEEAERYEEGRRQRTLARRLQEARDEDEELEEAGVPPEKRARLFLEAASRVIAEAEEPPPPFSVARLEETLRTLPPKKSTGWKTLDEAGVYLYAGELSLIAARTGHAKTSFLVNLLRSWLHDEKDEGLFVFYSHEEPEPYVFARLLALETTGGENPWSMPEVRDFLRDRGSRETWPLASTLDAAKAAALAWEGRLYVVNRPAWDSEKLASHARSLAQGGRKVSAVLVDYVQRVPAPPSRYDRRDIEVSAVSRSLKALAVDLACPVVAGAQINREAVPEKYADKLSGKTWEEALPVIAKARPRLEHLREGGLEQEADLVLGLLNYAADYVHEEERGAKSPIPDVTPLEAGVLKSRYGASGAWRKLAFQGKHGLIRDIETWEKGRF